METHGIITMVAGLGFITVLILAGAAYSRAWTPALFGEKRMPEGRTLAAFFAGAIAIPLLITIGFVYLSGTLPSG